MKKIIFFIGFALLSFSCQNEKQTNLKISVINDKNGSKLNINGEDLMINGMNWDYYPIGTNYEYSLWNQSDSIIKRALKNEMSLLKNMGVNAIRQYTGIPSKWITYIYENYGIYTMLNHSFGRYGVSINGNWISKTNYGDKKVQEKLISEIKQLAVEYKNTKGLLLYLIGNENNYGLFWEGAETEDIPNTDKNIKTHAREMYKLFNKAVIEIKKIDKTHPVAICNGDLQFIDIIKDECKDIDIFGINVYRGTSFGDLFSKVKEKLNKPILLTEFGADAYNSIKDTVDEKSQAIYIVENWKEIYENAYGFGKTANCLGGFTFQFSDGWWKTGQTTNLNVHDTHASWSNGGYKHDYIKGENNMNEEWFGICAKGKPDSSGLYELHPRLAFYQLIKIHEINIFDKDITKKEIKKYFSNIKH